MAMEKIGLGGHLTFNADQAIAGMGKARNALGQFLATAKKAPPVLNGVGGAMQKLNQDVTKLAAGLTAGIGKMASGFGSLGMALAPFTLGLGFGAGQAIAFEKAMSRVDAVTLGSAEEFQRLTREAKKLGIETVFSASEAAEGMEIMARAGATTQQIISGIGGVLSAASAEGIGMEKAAEIIGIANATMGKSWNDAAHTANVLAAASAATQSSIESLGESFSYGGLQANVAGMSMERTAAIMGLLHNAGLRGSTAGTALQNALIQLSKPTEKGTAILKKWGIQMTTEADGGLDFANIVTQISSKMKGLGTNLERTAAANELFGIRGGRAYFALTKAMYENHAAGEESVDALTDALKKASSAFDGNGTAAEMAKRQLDNVAGAWKLLTSTIEGANIEIFTPMLKPLATMIRHFTDFANIIVIGVMDIRAAGRDTEKLFNGMNTTFEKGGSTALNIVMGVIDAIDDIGDAFQWVETKINNIGAMFGQTFGGNTIRYITRFTLLFTVLAGVISPILIGIAGLAFAASALAPIFTGLLGVITAIVGAITWPVMAAIGVIGLAFTMFRRDGESVTSTVARAFFWVAAAVEDVWENGFKPLISGIYAGFMPIFGEITGQFGLIVNYARLGCETILKAMLGLGDDTRVDWLATGMMIGRVLGRILLTTTKVIAGMAEAFSFLSKHISMVMEPIKTTFGNLAAMISESAHNVGELWDGFSKLANGDIISGLKNIGMAIIRNLVTPIKFAIRQFIGLFDAIGQGDKIPDFIRGMMDTNEFEKSFGVDKAADKPKPTAPMQPLKPDQLFQPIELSNISKASQTLADQPKNFSAKPYEPPKPVQPFTMKAVDPLREDLQGLTGAVNGFSPLVDAPKSISVDAKPVPLKGAEPLSADLQGLTSSVDNMSMAPEPPKVTKEPQHFLVKGAEPIEDGAEIFASSVENMSVAPDQPKAPPPPKPVPLKGAEPLGDDMRNLTSTVDGFKLTPDRPKAPPQPKPVTLKGAEPLGDDLQNLSSSVNNFSPAPQEPPKVQPTNLTTPKATEPLEKPKEQEPARPPWLFQETPKVEKTVVNNLDTIVANDNAAKKAETGVADPYAPKPPTFLERVAFNAENMNKRILGVEGSSDAEEEKDWLGWTIAERAANQKKKEADKPLEAKVEINDKREITVNNKISLDGKELSRNAQRHREEIAERAGFRNTPWERRISSDHGASRLGGG